MIVSFVVVTELNINKISIALDHFNDFFYILLKKSYIRHENFCSSVRPSRSGDPVLDSETGWTGELWSKTNLLNWQNYSIVFFLVWPDNHNQSVVV